MRKPHPNHDLRLFLRTLRQLIAEGEAPERAGRRARAIIRGARLRKKRGLKPVVSRKPKKRGYVSMANRKPITPVLVNVDTRETSEGWVGITRFCNHYGLSSSELAKVRRGERKSPSRGWVVLQPVA